MNVSEPLASRGLHWCKPAVPFAGHTHGTPFFHLQSELDHYLQATSHTGGTSCKWSPLALQFMTAQSSQFHTTMTSACLRQELCRATNYGKVMDYASMANRRCKRCCSEIVCKRATRAATQSSDRFCSPELQVPGWQRQPPASETIQQLGMW